MNRLGVDLHLLDRQVLDDAGNKIGKVDDVELEVVDGRVTVSALLIGQRYLGSRIPGWVGKLITHLGDKRRLRIPYSQVISVESAVVVGVHAGMLPTPRLEAWLRAKVIGRIPGAGDEGK